MKWAEHGGKKFGGMEIDANEEYKADEEMAEEVDKGRGRAMIFRRRMLER